MIIIYSSDIRSSCKFQRQQISFTCILILLNHWWFQHTKIFILKIDPIAILSKKKEKYSDKTPRQIMELVYSYQLHKNETSKYTFRFRVNFFLRNHKFGKNSISYKSKRWIIACIFFPIYMILLIKKQKDILFNNLIFFRHTIIVIYFWQDENKR